MTYSAIVEILVIGNEILIGDIQDTNTSWLCRMINSRGGHVSRAAMLRDDLDVVAAEVRLALGRGPDVIFTSGGLGPTADDLTLAAVPRVPACRSSCTTKPCAWSGSSTTASTPWASWPRAG
jgi:molybdenum cofactor synthesis domain-containing protein